MRRGKAIFVAISLPLALSLNSPLVLADDLICIEPGAPMSLVETPDETLEELPSKTNSTGESAVRSIPNAPEAGTEAATSKSEPAPQSNQSNPTPEPVQSTEPTAATAPTSPTEQSAPDDVSIETFERKESSAHSPLLQQRQPRIETETSEIKIENPLQEQSEFNKTYPIDAPFALVAIRFPAEYTPNFVRNLNRLKMFRRDTLSTIRSYVDEQILKSAYYATEFYNYCSSRLPADSVIMEPMKVGFTVKGKVVTAPIRQAIPALITIDMFTSLNADRVRVQNCGSKQKDTFADYVNVVANIQKATKNGYVAVGGLPIKNDNHYGMTIADFYNTIGDGTEPHYESRVGELDISHEFPPKPNTFCELKTVYKCSTKSIIEPERLIDGQGEAACAPIWSQFQSIIVTALRTENFKELQPYLMAGFVEDIDPEISELLAHGEKIEHTAGVTRRKMELLRRYMDNERRQIFSLEAQRTEESLYSGELGDSVRSIAKSELEYLKHRSSSKRRQYAEGMLGLAAGAGSLAAAVGTQTPAFSNLLTTISFASVGMLQNESRVQQKLRDTFRQFERQSTDLQTTFMLKFGSDALEVSGNNIDELRAKFKQKYQERFEAFSMAASSHDSN